MTYHGTNTYIVNTPDGTFVVDPGPSEDTEHFDAILEALGDDPAGILVSHHHSDHFGAAPALKRECPSMCFKTLETTPLRQTGIW